MKKKFPSKIFIDGGDPEESRQAKKLLGYIDGQTTNPTLISKNPEVALRISRGEKFTVKEAYQFYKKVVQQFDKIVDWSISVEPYADAKTTSKEIFSQSQEMARWTEKAWIKFPATFAGIKAAQSAIKKGIRCNMTLCFSQEQAAAVYLATRTAKSTNSRFNLANGGVKGQDPVFLSPFVGRLDDRGENGMQLIENILKMYRGSDGHVWTLTASVRHINHLLYALKLKSPIITVPFKIFKEWADRGFPVPDESFVYNSGTLQPIHYKEISLNKPWIKYNIRHDLTDIGIQRFSADWNAMVKG